MLSLCGIINTCVETNKRNMKTQPQIRNIVLEMSGFCLASKMRTDDKK